jgi:AmmeMemoRadiSam system protein B
VNRKAAVAGTWYPGTASALIEAVDAHLENAADLDGDLVALVAPHAGLMYSGTVAAHAYHLLRGRTFDRVVLVGPSHFVGFEGVAAFPGGAFQTPLGLAKIDEAATNALVQSTRVIAENAAVHGREHSLEMQLPFLQRLAPRADIVALLVGYQTASTADALADAMAKVFEPRPRTLLVASSDLSHYRDAATARRLDSVILDCLARFDADDLQRALDEDPQHACGGGPMVAVLRAAHRLGARDSRVLNYADSGDVSGDKNAVVGYVAAAFGAFTMDRETVTVA